MTLAYGDLHPLSTTPLTFADLTLTLLNCDTLDGPGNVTGVQWILSAKRAGAEVRIDVWASLHGVSDHHFHIDGREYVLEILTERGDMDLPENPRVCVRPVTT